MTNRRAAFRAFPAPLCLALLAMAASAGCSAVLTVEPVGSEPVTLDPAEWDGVWCDVEAASARLSGAPVDWRDCLTLTVIDPAEGTLKVADLASDEPEHAAIVRRHPGATALFLTIPWPPEADDHPFWVRIRVSDDVLLFWEPKPDAFKALVETGVLPGSADQDVVLLPLDAEGMAVIVGRDAGLFAWEQPHVLVRLER